MSRNTRAVLARICIILSMMAVMYSGFWISIIWLFMGGISQLYGAEAWLSVEFMQGVARVMASGPATCLFTMAFSLLIRACDKLTDWQKGRA